MALKYFVVVLAIFTIGAVADITISKPNTENYAVANTTYEITWDYSGTVPDQVSIKLVDNRPTNRSFEGKFGIGNGPTSAKKFSWLVDASRVPGDDYAIEFLNTNDTASAGPVLAKSKKFSIKKIGTEPYKEVSKDSPSSTPSSGSSPSSSSGSSSPTQAKSAAASNFVTSFTIVLGFVTLAVVGHTL